MDYSKMSDFEINKAVGESTGEALNTEETLNLVIRNSTGRRFDPCNSWADAGPIIEKFGIGLMPFKKSPAKAWPLSVGLLSNAGVEHENPLRAAMIVYLMMHDKGEE
ncbi:phage protein NinX family protein [Mixta sp. Marseille-Q2659]|uniref:phage protein NinX family protein n=1 Tax=Mixta sp. Marseille-Q2659 TaxID=2736607 RepID=UPI0023B8EC67|nr:phage protein NinX family protein [Mixta sp. Marseille-Q2659]